jgi:hypothetical protein
MGVVLRVRLTGTAAELGSVSLEVDASTLGELGLLSTLRTAPGESDDAIARPSS